MTMRLTGAGLGVLIGIVVSAALAFLLGYPELLGLTAGGLVLLAVAAFLVSGGGPIEASAAVPPPPAARRPPAGPRGVAVQVPPPSVA
ncbi:MAG: hypothetical protein VW239_11595 [Candidatus Nanopelagicales bacterium]